MRLFLPVLLLALIGADDHEDFLKETINKIVSVVPPSSTIQVPINKSGSLKFSTKTFKDGQENFVLVKSSAPTFASPYNILAHLHSERAAKIVDASYTGRITVTSDATRKFNIEVAGIDKTDREYYLIFSATDPMIGPVKVEVDDSMYQANVYTGGIMATYAQVGDAWMLFASQEASGVADISTSDGITFIQASDDQKAAANLNDAGCTVVVAQKPNGDWFGLNRASEYVTVKTQFSQTQVLRFIDGDDMRSDAKPVLVGWEIEFDCGPIPSNAKQVELIAGNFKTEQTTAQRKDISDITQNNGRLQFKKITATSDMVGQSGGLTCRFFSADDRNLGITTPRSYVVHDGPSDRPSFEVLYKATECGWVEGENQEIAVCKVPDASMADVFPPVQLQWEVTWGNGTITNIPEQPTETMNLALTVTIASALKQATIKCLDIRSPDPRNPSNQMVQDIGQTEPTNPVDLKLKEYTSTVIVDITGGYTADCKSDVFGVETTTENVCSDIVNWNKEATICPFTKTNGNVTCTANMVGGADPISNMWTNKDCLAYNPNPAPCEESAVKKCPPPTQMPEPGENAGEAGSSKMWLIFFLIAAALGVVLVFINKRGNKDESTKPVPDTADENSLLNDQGGPATVVTFEDEQTPPPTIKIDHAVVESVPEEAVEPEKTIPQLYPEIPLIDEPTDTNK